ncbi:unnamed protein product [Linum tenue]|uniref:Uncharacterized protein n=1 Tax=Linum tenue TaxID=586396 RepID=A0AAV0HBB9_9ROSI|nr:unnamed protein product [Linum tenue]
MTTPSISISVHVGLLNRRFYHHVKLTSFYASCSCRKTDSRQVQLPCSC